MFNRNLVSWRAVGLAALAAGLLTLAGPAQAITDFDTLRYDLTIGDGGDDQFDPRRVVVDGENLVSTVAGVMPDFVMASVVINGDIEVTGQARFFTANGTASANTKDPGELDYVYFRQLYQFTNTGLGPLNFPVVVEWDLGSDGATIVHATSSGDTDITASDLWSVTDDAVDGGPAEPGGIQDPAVALLIADGSNLLPTEFLELGPGLISVRFQLALDPGETRSLLFFTASRNETDTFPQTASRAQSQADIEALLADPDLQFDGISTDIAGTVVNFSAPRAPSEPVNVPVLSPHGLAILALLMLALAVPLSQLRKARARG